MKAIYTIKTFGEDNEFYLDLMDDLSFSVSKHETQLFNSLEQAEIQEYLVSIGFEYNPFIKN